MRAEIMNEELLQILSKMNGGSVLSNQPDNLAKRDLFSNDVSLFIDEKDNKHYFFAEYNLEGNTDNYHLIQRATIQNQEAFGNSRVNPSDAYLILFWKVDEINDFVYSRVIKFEENEMFYKKYLIYYTEEELSALTAKLNEYEEVNLQKLIEDISSGEVDAIDWKLAIRIMTKIPFWSLTFPSAVMGKFEEMVEQSINNTTNNTDIDAILELKHFIDRKPCEVDEMVDKIFLKYMGDFF